MNSPRQPGRPRGARTSPPTVSVTAARLALREVEQRAKQGSAEDQRALLAVYAATVAPAAVPGGIWL